MRFPAAAPQLIFRVAEYLRDHGTLNGTLHLPGSLYPAGSNIRRAGTPDVGSPARTAAIAAAYDVDGRRDGLLRCTEGI